MAREPFFRSDGADGRRFHATASTRGPWSNDHQHAGPPTALLARALERELGADRRLARITCEMLRPIPVGQVTVELDVEKQGKKSTLARARLLVEGGAVAIDARALLVREVDTPVVRHDPPPPLLATATPYAFTFFRSDVGYHTAVELRLLRGVWGSGAMACWMRQRVPLVDDEAPSGAQRALVLADAGSGVSAALDPRRFRFANADLSVHLERPPVGEWIVLDATTATSGNGAALASTLLQDERGSFGHGLQTLVVEAQEGPASAPGALP